MTFEQEPQLKKADSPDDFHTLAKATLEAVANNHAGALGGQLIAEVQSQTGYEPAYIAAVFAELGDQGVVERSLKYPRAGVVLTEQGRTLYEHYDQLMGLDQQ